ncbi:MAG: squalene/phytoene synthase family protein [Verrucomicrobiae bacterium]|nr:squalene/phytoene synthase family protein [Verrucomicrobiae bacterium]
MRSGSDWAGLGGALTTMTDASQGIPFHRREMRALLRDTSRSFYLTLRVLPSGVQEPIGLAYLLARTTDTVADTGLVPVAERLEALDTLRDRILGRRADPCDFSRIAAAQSGDASDAERRLLLRTEPALRLLETLTPEDRSEVRDVLETITGGQVLDLTRFGGQARGVRALESDAELDDYTYRVAGCVGEFWTRLTRRHCFPEASLGESEFLADGIRLGHGLQLVNILRDLPKDLLAGRCYLPRSGLAAVGLTPEALLEPSSEPRLRPLYQAWWDRAMEHLAAGWRYTNTIPRAQSRLRLACAWPVLLGVRTLAKLRSGPVLDPSVRLKVSRAEVRQVLIGSLMRLPFRRRWESQFESACRFQTGI